jgi:ferredoxin
MIREIIEIDEAKCDGCGLCVSSCHEGALALVNGKAKLVRDVYCDGLGNCIPACPQNALTFIKREAADFDENAGRLNQWPVQLKLVSPTASFFNDADVLLSADCAAYSYGNFHNDFMKNKITLIGCPKLDGVDYSGKLGEIFKNGCVKSITIVRMEVPCCGGLEWMVRNALKISGANITEKIITLSTQGTVLEGGGVAS